MPEAVRLSPAQRLTVAAAYLGWTLDAFDFFLLVFLLKPISEAFGTSVKEVSEALFLTLAARPVGALLFGTLADRYGRRPVLMAVVVLFSLFSAATGLAQSLAQLLAIRLAFGVAMGGEWGIGASLAMESIPPAARGRVSGLLQAGYASGYLLASLAYYLLFDAIGWRGMCFVGLAPALLALLIRLKVEESPRFAVAQAAPRPGVLASLAEHWKLALYLVVLMTAFNFFSHGTGDLYPTFLQKQHHFTTRQTGALTAVLNVGSLVGSFVVGALSERFGRRRMIAVSALLALPVIPLWAYGSSILMLGLGAFLMGAMVQGAWSAVPAYLNELAPPAVRAMFPGLVYQLGNLIASRNAPIQAGIAEAHGGDYAYALALVGALAVVALALLATLGPERRGAELA
ncbi:MAG: MFS transporter [Proteobacteria bacterium]|nr:MFS transporter [Pseudomonadota bacterium]